jgi:ATP-binding cassette, subfamily B, bacterial
VTGPLRRVLRPQAGRLALSVAAALAGMVAAAVTPVFLQRGIDAAITGRGQVAGCAVALGGLGMARGLFALLRRWYGGRASIEVEAGLRRAIHDHVHTLDPASAARFAPGDVFSLANGDVSQIGQLIASLGVVLGSLVYVAISLSVMFAYSAPLAGVVLVALPVVAAVSRAMSHRLLVANRDAQASRSRLVTVAEEAVRGVRLVKGFGQEGRELARFRDSARVVFRDRVATLRLESRYGAALQVVPGVGLGVIFAFGGRLALDDRVSTGTLLAFCGYLVQLTATVKLLANGFSVAQAARAGALRVTDLLGAGPAVVEFQGARGLPPGPGGVRFEDVTVAYGPGRPALDGFSLDVAPGETVALVGASGSGKTTAALLLARLRDPDGGRVLLDGVDLRDLTLESLHREVGVAFEDPVLFSGTVADNIAFGASAATSADIWAAAQMAGAHGFIAGLPEGYGTAVGEGGVSLSGGQRQRVGLSRALLRPGRVLVLDDPTGAVDVGTEFEILDSLRPALTGRTVILVARRPSTVFLADRVAIVDGGRVVDQGTPEELLRRSRRYRGLITGASMVDDDPAAAPRSTGDRREAGPTPVRRSVDVADDTEHDTDERADGSSGVLSLRAVVLADKRSFVAAVAVLLFDSLLPLGVPVVFKVGIDRGLLPGSPMALWGAALTLLVLAAAGSLAAWRSALLSGLVAERALLRIRIRIFAHLQRLSLDFYERQPSGMILSRATADIDALATFLKDGAATLLVSLIRLLGMTVVLFILDRRLATAALVFVPVLIVATVRFRRASDVAYGLEREHLATANAFLQESLSGLALTWVCGEQARQGRRFAEAIDDYRRAQLAGQRASCAYFPLVEFTGVAAAVAVLGVGAPLVAAGSLTPGGLAAFVLYLTQLFAPVQQLGSVYEAYQRARAARCRLDQLLSEPVAVFESSDSVPVDASRHDLVLDNVRFRYPGAAGEALRDVSLVIPAGQTLALVGETGAGKSTLLKLLARFYDPTAGSVLVGNRDLRSVKGWRQQIAIVPQEVTLFSGTVRDNIAYGRPDASDAEVREAARLVGVDEIIDAFPDGFDTVIGARGRVLSAGHRQLVGLARAHLANPQVLLLDEATSQLDLTTEASVRRAMDRVRAQRTTVLIAHRLSTARHADRIAVLHDGLVVEVGTHDELVERGAWYSRLWSRWESGMAAAEPLRRRTCSVRFAD